ncbi:hypothetical protein Golax_025643 [Gossypium laxum]|uniref:Uncharacterized protein n=1 Tax=Gossypium laxum TaxID=34288 RepID=A0A7J9B5S5_9ROSI|nr:hypothetical protein [Gossypium laxum]
MQYSIFDIQDNVAVRTWAEMTQNEKVIAWPRDTYQNYGTSPVLE